MIPIDTATGLQSSMQVHGYTVDVQVGYLLTHPDGSEALLKTDRAGAELYAAKHRATIERAYVLRSKGHGKLAP